MMTKNSMSSDRAWIAVSMFVSGMGVATYLLRLRDRARLRHACSRTLKHLVAGQRAALGPLLTAFRPKAACAQVLVIGAGSYGTSMAYVACKNGHDVVMYMRDSVQCAHMNKEGYNPKYLSTANFNDLDGTLRGICTTPDLQCALEMPGVVVILALPCQKTPAWIKEHRDLIPPNVLLCSTAKGLYLPTKQLMGHAILDALDRAQQPLAFLSGPSFAEEIVKSFPTAGTYESACDKEAPLAGGDLKRLAAVSHRFVAFWLDIDAC